MKILELDLKKKVLIVDENDFDYYELSENGIYFKLEKGDRYYLGWKFEFLCKGSDLTEEIASELVKKILPLYYAKQNRAGISFNSSRNDLTKSAKESFISEIKSKKFHWLENPFKDWRSDGEIHDDDLDLIYKEAEEKTFRNPLIFVKK